MSSEHFKIGVCLLTFNHVDTIESTVRGVLSQNIDNFEIVLSDDCSTDGTWERILEIAAANPSVRAVKTPVNLGMAGNANFAVSQVHADYVALLHHDDIYRHDLLEKWAGVLNRHPDVSFVFNAYGRYEEAEIDAEPMPGERVDGNWLLEKYLFPRWGCLIRGTSMVRMSAWEDAKGMRERFGLLADIDLWMRLAMRGPVGYVSEPLICVRHARPDYYPAIYRSELWSWKRLRLLYDVHAQNRLIYFSKWSVQNRLKWGIFRIRLSAETAKWIAYAWFRNRHEMLRDCGESSTPYDLWLLKAFRSVVLRIFRLSSQ